MKDRVDSFSEPPILFQELPSNPGKEAQNRRMLEQYYSQDYQTVKKMKEANEKLPVISNTIS